MGKVKTIIVNKTDKILQLFEQTPFGEYRELAKLLPNGNPTVETTDATVLRNPNATVETTERNPQLKSIEGLHDYLIEIDPNDTYWTLSVCTNWTLSVWHGMEAVLNMTSDDLIDSAVITIGWDTEKKVFIRIHEPRPTSRQRKATSPSASAPAAMQTQQAFHSNSKVSWWRSFQTR
jgi:hypothetical protein